jgi:hypothetical protein
MTCLDHPQLYRQADARATAPRADYRDPVRTEEERKAIATRLAKSQAALRRAKLAERWIVYTIAAMLVIAMLPVLIAVAAMAAAVTVWRRVSRSVTRRPDVAATDEPSAETAREQLASVREVWAGIHLPRHRATIEVRPRKRTAGAKSPWRREQAMKGV